MIKFLKDTPVYLACPSCGRTQKTKLKWAKHHKALKCKHCKKNIDLRDKPVRRVIARTTMALTIFEHALETLQRTAKKSGKSAKKSKKKSKATKKKGAKRARSRKAATKSAAPAASSESEPTPV